MINVFAKRLLTALATLLLLLPAPGFAKEFTITSANWLSPRSMLVVKGASEDLALVVLRYPADGAVIGATRASSNGDWTFRKLAPSPVPCSVVARSQDKTARATVSRAPADCSNSGNPPVNLPPVADANGPYSGAPGEDINFSSTGSNDPDGSIVAYAWDFGDGSSSTAANPVHAYTAAGDYNVVLSVTDNEGASDSDASTATIADEPPPMAGVSINSVSTNGTPGDPVMESTFSGNNGYRILAINDLGMHCGDLDTRQSSVLPPFNLMHAQVLQIGSQPTLLDQNDGIEVFYSAASNPSDPILSGFTSTGLPVASSMLADGSVYKTNFWDIAFDAYDPFYPNGILDLFWPAGTQNRGLPMPDVERLYLGDGELSADQQDMPGIAAPYLLNEDKEFSSFINDMPFFINFAFGYTARNVGWFEAAGVPLTAFDDFGRENPWPLYRVQAKSNGSVLASVDTVAPISGEANCGACHNHPDEAVMLGGNGVATQNLPPDEVATTLDDPELDAVPLAVSLEYAADLNLLRLHDQKHGTSLENDAPVVCQRCHYTPALDLAQLGPFGPENDGPLVINGVTISDSIANGRDQIKNKSMSNVMHSHHGETGLFPAMPPAVDDQGNLRGGTENPVVREILEATCYQCHPGRRTDCLRGAMANGGMVCQDCHGDMTQVGNDFSRNVSPDNPGAFELASDFYTNPDAVRVPWANEPGCGSCHTGDANDNLHGTPGTVGDPQDGIRLMQAYLSNDSKATPIVPDNKRFAENTVAAGDPGAGNPMLYRVSTGHGGVMCEGCHGATHGIWPNKNPEANDNVTAEQLQGHRGVIIECSTCHGNSMNNQITLDGPHGMHPVGANTAFADGGHEHLAENNPSACSACHGPGSRSNNQGTALSVAKADRVLRGQLVQAGEPVGCSVCHGQGGLD